jgi:hypothetical protein
MEFRSLSKRTNAFSQGPFSKEGPLISNSLKRRREGFKPDAKEVAI